VEKQELFPPCLIEVKTFSVIRPQNPSIDIEQKKGYRRPPRDLPPSFFELRRDKPRSN